MAALLFVLLAGSPLAAQKVYWSHAQAGWIAQTNADGTGTRRMISSEEQSAISSIALHATSGELYWLEPQRGRLRRARRDGGDPVDVLTGIGQASAFALDEAAGRLYWADARGRIWVADMDGTHQAIRIAGLTDVTELALDAQAGHLYWLDRGAGKVQRANLDGSGMVDLVSELVAPQGLALDALGGRLYWSLPDEGLIQSAWLDGQDVRTMLADLTTPTTIAIDAQGERLFWLEMDGAAIRCAALNGLNVEAVLDISPGRANHILVVRVDPSACFTTSAHYLDRQDWVFFDATLSRHLDPTHGIARVDWDFDYDGRFFAEGAGVVVGKRYDTGGLHLVAMRVTDDTGAWDMLAGNYPPIAHAGGPYTLSIGNDLALLATYAMDPDRAWNDTLVSYTWDLDDDGVFGDATGPAPRVPWYQLEAMGLDAPGEAYPIRVRVTDSFGAMDEALGTLTMVASPPAASVESPTLNPLGSRYLEITPADGDEPVALLVTGALFAESISCVSGYVQQDGTLGVAPVFALPSEWGTRQVTSAGLVPGATYTACSAVQALQGLVLSPSVHATLASRGDINDDGMADMSDLLLIIDLAGEGDGFGEALYADLFPCTADRSVNLIDQLEVLDALGSVPNACPMPCQPY